MAKSDSVQRVREAADTLGLDIEVLTLPVSARTAQLAADGLGCAVGQIVKSLIFRGAETGALKLLLISGARQADLAKAAKVVGEPLERADARLVRDETGFATGGVAPIGHKAPVATWIDQSLLAHDAVWAAAGAPNAVFAIAPKALAEMAGATVADIAG